MEEGKRVYIEAQDEEERQRALVDANFSAGA